MSNQHDRLMTLSAPGDTFETVVLPHIDAARRLARWLVRNEHDAEDAVQEASLRALRYFRTFAGGSGRAWFLQIVRNSCHGRRQVRFQPPADLFDEEQHSAAAPALDPEALLLQSDDAELIERAMRRLTRRAHDLLVLREWDGLSYQEVADTMGIPCGTVMSGLSRARHALRGALQDELRQQSGIPLRGDPREQEAEALRV